MKMASITKQRIGKYIYLYESVSYRDEYGRPRNKKKRIGKIDPQTGQTIYVTDYVKQKADEPVQTANDFFVAANEYAQEALDSVKIYGTYWFVENIANKIGLIKILKQSFQSLWQEIFTLASYLMVSDKPVMYCEDWLSENEWMATGSMSSQRISEILSGFDENNRNKFYREWSGYIQEKEYLALDITSVSSYSQQITDCEWGYNRDMEKLPQVNLCLLHGEKSGLPVYQTSYSGSLSDVVTLENTLSEFHGIVGERIFPLVMDKGFYILL